MIRLLTACQDKCSMNTAATILSEHTAFATVVDVIHTSAETPVVRAWHDVSAVLRLAGITYTFSQHMALFTAVYNISLSTNTPVQHTRTSTKL